ncbi:MAG: DsbE family thiol:disulfide interchange protein [Gammaproteobacteria bacterium]|nr:DsbE family thiol:disulfide interchange protein [Gammaproteobacteria bacterium]
MTRRQWRILLACPLLGFLALVFILTIAFDLGRHDIHPSSLIDKPFPDFELPSLRTHETVNLGSLLGEARLINIWASWCIACRSEHGLLQQIAERGDVSIVGVNYKDQRSDAVSWLFELGDPFAMNIFDSEGDLGVDLGVYGAPETFLVDAQGFIRYKRVGPLTDQIWQDEIEPILRSWD